MDTRRPIRAIAFAVMAIAALIAACGGGDKKEPSASTGGDTMAAGADTSAEKKHYVVFADYVNPEDSLPRLRFREDGQVSINDRCAVRKVKLNPRMPAAYVNGRPVGFC